MKAINTVKPALLITLAFLIISCGGYKGSASDTTGTNGATNGNGKVISTSAHKQDTK
jgi:hypothetical protein